MTILPPGSGPEKYQKEPLVSSAGSPVCRVACNGGTIQPLRDTGYQSSGWRVSNRLWSSVVSTSVTRSAVVALGIDSRR